MPKKLSLAAQEAGTAAEEAIERALDKHLPGDEKFAMRMLALLVVAASEFAKVECPGCRKKRLDGAVDILRGMVAQDDDTSGQHLH